MFQVKNQALFSLKDKSKKLKCRLLQFLFGALRVKYIIYFFFLRITGFAKLLQADKDMLIEKLGKGESKGEAK